MEVLDDLEREDIEFLFVYFVNKKVLIFQYLVSLRVRVGIFSETFYFSGTLVV